MLNFELSKQVILHGGILSGGTLDRGDIVLGILSGGYRPGGYGPRTMCVHATECRAFCVVYSTCIFRACFVLDRPTLNRTSKICIVL